MKWADEIRGLLQYQDMGVLGAETAPGRDIHPVEIGAIRSVQSAVQGMAVTLESNRSTCPPKVTTHPLRANFG